MRRIPSSWVYSCLVVEETPLCLSWFTKTSGFTLSESDFCLYCHAITLVVTKKCNWTLLQHVVVLSIKYYEKDTRLNITMFLNYSVKLITNHLELRKIFLLWCYRGKGFLFKMTYLVLSNSLKYAKLRISGCVYRVTL